ncbi:MAG: hypothetical protein FWG67_05675 [Defluviitaleaceae bacterium]|nr:hypothetical protein [Defluviitaleaceae bacterium]
MESLKKSSKYIVIALLIMALVGMALPLVHVSVHFLGTVNMSFSLIDLLGAFGGELPQETLDLGVGDLLFEEIGLYVGLPLLAYVVAMIVIITTFLLAFTAKFKLLKIVLVSMATALMIFVGRSVTALPVTLSDHFEDILADAIGGFAGFFSSMIDLSTILEIDLGFGYWLTLIMLLMLLPLLIVTRIMEYLQKH